MEDQIDVSVVIGTYNRGHMLGAALESLMTQEANGVRYEVIVVDNNSTDNTREVIHSFAGRNIAVRYIFEGRQGISHARNAGISRSHSPLVAFTDDDIRVAADWITTIKRSFDAHPEVGFIGGKVLPVWTETPPAWLTRDHWMPLGLQDHGDSQFYLDQNKVIGVISANLAVRRELFDRVGMFTPQVHRVKSGIGTMEDHEFIIRLWQAGVIGLYLPRLLVHAPVERERTRKKYHRRWHKGHGRSYAILREERMEKASWYLFGVPAHLYRQAMSDTMGLIKNWLWRRESHAFLCEVHLWFFLAFWLKRLQDGARAT